MKNTFRILFAVVLALTMCVAGFALTLDRAEAADVTETSEAVLAADFVKGVKPGLNMIGQTSDAWSFEEADGMNNVSMFSGAGNVVANPLADSVNGSSLVSCTTHTGAGYPTLQFNLSESVDGARPVYVSFKYYKNYTPVADEAGTTGGSLWVMRNGATYIAKSIGGFGFNTTWKQYAGLVKFDDAYHASTNKKNPEPISSILLETQVAQNKVQTGTDENEKPVYGYGKTNVYYDDVSFIPSYKVTYMNEAGDTEVYSEYVLLDSNGKIMTEYTYDLAKVTGATGYAASVGGERLPATFALANKDVVLYALTRNEASFVGGNTVKNVAFDGSYTFTTAEALGIEIENFRCWTDGTNFYVPGTVVADSSTLVGKTFKAVCFEVPLFDETFGDLIAFYDFEGRMTPTYINAAYDTQGNNAKTVFSNGNSLSGVRAYYDEDGNTAAEAYTTATSAYFRFAAANIRSDIAGQYTSRAKVKLPEDVARTNFNDSLWLRVAAPGNNPYLDRFTGTSVSSADFTTWQTGRSTLVVPTLNQVGVNWNSKGFNSSYLFDDFQVYGWPSNVVIFEPFEDDYVRKTVAADATEYTFPTPEELGVEIAHFLRWTDGTNYYKAGETVALDKVQYKLLKPFCQDASLPAVSFKFEGDAALGGNITDGNGNTTYSETITDDGRSVLHLHAWKKAANKDYRVWFKSGDAPQYDVNEYKHFQFVYKTNNVYKVDSTAASGYSKQSSWGTSVYVNYNGNGGYYREKDPYVLYQFGKSGITHDTSDEYLILEKDLSTISTVEGYPIGYGFAIDPVNTGDARWGHDIYIDYIRVYRAGATTVTYATNAPEGATVVAEVPADTNRGVGTGYLLKGLRPEVEGYIFMGWALTPDATADETVEAIDLTDDTTVYAVWESEEKKAAPETTSEVEIKGNGDDNTNGIRFKSSIMPSVKVNLDEFGFIATREVLLPVLDSEANTYNHNALTFLHREKGSKKNYYASGIAYDADGNIDVINSDGDDGSIIYTMVLSGIPLANKNETMVVRAYAKFNMNGNEMIVYSDTKAASLYETALAIKEANGEAYANNKAYIDSILAEEA